MGISAQQLIESDPEYLQYSQQLKEMKALNPTGSAAGAIGMLLGGGIRNVQEGRDFFDPFNPGLKRFTDVNKILKSVQFDPNNPAAYYQQVAAALQEAGYSDLAPMAYEEARKLAPKREIRTVGNQIVDVTGGTPQVLFTGTDKEAMVKTPADFAAAGRELGFGVRPNIGDYTQQETSAINNLLETRGLRRAAAGVPGSGEVKVSDIKGAQDIVATYTKAPQDRLSTVRQLRVSLGEAKQGTGAALPQLRRDLVKLVGDNQIGQGEVQQALGSIGIVGDAISGINQLFTGVPSAEKLKDVEKFITALETEHAKSYNRGRETANKVLSEAKLSPETVKTLIPPEYKTGREKKTSNFVEGKIYKDAKGNRARYVNGKWEPVQ